MELYPIQSVGIRAYCSDLIIDSYEMNTVYFMSIGGYQVAVKGIIANLLEHNGISINIEGDIIYLSRSGFGYRTLVKKLPSGLAHGLVFPETMFSKNAEDKQNYFDIFTNKEEGILSLFFRHLDEKTEIPLHPSWDKWLWGVFEEQEHWITELKTIAGEWKGFSFKFNPQQLHDLISDAIRDRVPEVTQCMEWKGGDSDGAFNFTEGFPR